MYTSYSTLQRKQLSKQVYTDTQSTYLLVYAPGRHKALQAALQNQLHRKFRLVTRLEAGDPVYGPHNCITSLHGQCLHAKTLGFVHPITGEHLRFDSELPEYFTHFLATLRRGTL